MMRARTPLISLALLTLSLVLHAVPQVAVLDAVLAAGIDPTVAVPITDKIIEELVNSRKFTVIDRANVEQVLREKEFQLSSGIVRNEEVRRAGEYLGADFVVVANVSRVGSTYVVSAKMIDVVSGEIASQASAEREGKIDVVLQLARVVGAQISGQAVAAPAAPAKAAEKKPEKAPAKEPTKEPPKAKPPAPPPAPTADKRYILGLRGGANLSGVGYPDGIYYVLYGWTPFNPWTYGEPYATLGGNFGVYFVINTGRFLSWQFELDYSAKGYAVDVVDDYFATTAYQTNYFTFNYLEIPMMAKLRIPGRFSPYALLGAYLSVVMNGTVELVYDESFYQSEFDSTYTNPMDLEDIGIYLNGLDYGWVIGIGLDYTLRSIVLNAEVKYSGGISFADEDQFIRNGALTATVGVGWAFGQKK